jgi:hypothetical protein
VREIAIGMPDRGFDERVVGTQVPYEESVVFATCEHKRDVVERGAFHDGDRCTVTVKRGSRGL